MMMLFCHIFYLYGGEKKKAASAIWIVALYKLQSLCTGAIIMATSCSLDHEMLTGCRSIKVSMTEILNVFKSMAGCLFCWLHLIWMTFDIKVDGELQSDTFLHCFLQGGDLLSNKLVPGDEGHRCFDETSGLEVNHMFPRFMGCVIRGTTETLLRQVILFINKVE